MTRWGQFVAMGMAQLTGRCSLRDIVSNLAAPSCKLYHLGVGVVTRSSLARVNAEKPWKMYEELHGRLLGRCRAKAPGHGYRFKAKLFGSPETGVGGLRPVGSADKSGAAEERWLGTEVDSRLSTAQARWLGAMSGRR